MSLTANLKEYALSLGYASIGILPVEDFSFYIQEVASRGDSCAWISQTPVKDNPVLCARIREQMPEAKSIIVLLLDYIQKSMHQSLKTIIGTFYLSRCFQPLPESLNGQRLALFIDFLQSQGIYVRKDLGIPARAAAAKAGLAAIGKSTFAYAPGIGSSVVIYTLAIDKELEYSTPIALQDECLENCGQCQQACPTGALYAPYKVDSRKCVSYLNFVAMRDIPRSLRSKIGQRIHGCNVCQDVCPRNQEKQKQTLPEDEYLINIAGDINPANILEMRPGYYETRLRPILYNYVSKHRIFQRNAAIAIGNSQNRDYVPALEKALSNPEPIVREYVVWALAQIGGSKAKQLLDKLYTMETDNRVREEIAASS